MSSTGSISYQPWGISPISLLEVRFLAETGRLGVRSPEFEAAVSADPRVALDEVPLLALARHAKELDSTRGPFDRFLSASTTSIPSSLGSHAV